MKYVEFMKLSGMFGLGIDFARDDFWEYKWWEFEVHLTLGKFYVTVRINSHV